MKPDLQPWIVQLRATEAPQRAAAAEHLCRLAEEAKEAAPDLVRACADADPTVRDWATSALEGLGPPQATDVATLVSLLKSENPDVGYWSATLLGRLKKQAVTAVSGLAAALSHHPQAAVRHRAAWALGEIGVDQGARTALEQAAESDDPRLKRLAKAALDQWGGS